MIGITNLRRSAASFLALALAGSLLVGVVTIAQGGPPADVVTKIEEHREQAKQKISEKRENAQVKSAEKRQEACERRVSIIEDKLNRMDQHANRLLGVIDSFYTKVTGFYEKGQLTVSNYDELLAAVDEAKATASAEVAAMADLSVDIDCTDPEVAVVIGSFREATSSARTALKAYRAALVDLISAMRAAAAEENAGDDSASEDEDADDGADEDEADDSGEEETEEETDTDDDTSDGSSEG